MISKIKFVEIKDGLKNIKAILLSYKTKKSGYSPDWRINEWVMDKDKRGHTRSYL